MRWHPGKDAALSEGTKISRPVNNDSSYLGSRSEGKRLGKGDLVKVTEHLMPVL